MNNINDTTLVILEIEWADCKILILFRILFNIYINAIECRCLIKIYFFECGKDKSVSEFDFYYSL